MIFLEKEIRNYLQIPGVQQYLLQLKDPHCSSRKVTADLAMALYSGACKSPRMLRYKDTFHIAFNLVEFYLQNNKIISFQDPLPKIIKGRKK
jgi:hypothetical protein